MTTPIPWDRIIEIRDREALVLVSRAGNEHRSRVGLSLLSSLGLESLVARDENSLVSIAANLAADMQQLRTFRFELRSLLLSSPLCDAARLTAGLETELIKILETGPIIRD